MKKVMLSLASASMVAFTVGSASAQCDFNATAKAKGVNASLVRTFAACPSTDHPAMDLTSTEGGTTACAPVKVPGDVAGTLYSLDPQKGKCAIKTQSKLVPDCSTIYDPADPTKTPLGLPAEACHIIYVSGKCSKVLNPGGDPIGEDDDGFTLATLTRATLNDDTNGDMTVIDFPVTFDWDEPKKGNMKLKSHSAAALVDLVGATGATLPTCTSVEVVNLVVKDPNGDQFAKLGGSTRAKDE